MCVSDSESVLRTGKADKSQADLASILGILSVLIFSANGELLQALQGNSKAATISPLANIVLCHSGGLIFLPSIFRPRAAQKTEATNPEEFSWLYICASSLLFACLLAGYNYAWIRSTAYVPVALTNVLSQASLMFVYVLNTVLFDEPREFQRILGVFLCVLGLVLGSGLGSTWLGDSSIGSEMMTGVSLALLSAVGNTVYQVLFKYMFGKRKGDGHFLKAFMAWISLHHVIVMLPLVLIFDGLGIEKLVIPSDTKGIIGAFASGIAASSVNMMYLCILLWGWPMLLPCANVLTIPMMTMLDSIIHGFLPQESQLVGHALVAVSLMLILGRSNSAKCSGSLAIRWPQRLMDHWQTFRQSRRSDGRLHAPLLSV